MVLVESRNPVAFQLTGCDGETERTLPITWLALRRALPGDTFCVKCAPKRGYTQNEWVKVIGKEHNLIAVRYNAWGYIDYPKPGRWSYASLILLRLRDMQRKGGA